MLDVTTPRSEEKRLKWMPSNFILAAIFIISIAIFLLNGRSDGHYGDFEPIYGSIQCTLSHSNPYSIPDVQAALISHGADASRYTSSFWQTHALLYPPLTYYLLSPLALLNYPAAGLAYFWVSALTIIAGCFLIIRLSPPYARTVVVLGVSAVLMTSSVLLRLGQVSTLTIALLVMGTVLFANRKYPILAAILFLFAAGLKPQLVMPLMVYFCLPRFTRKYALGALAAFVLVSAAAGLALAHQPSSAHWVADLTAEVHSAVPFGPGARIDTGLIDLKSLTSLVSGSPYVYQSFDLLVFATIILVLGFGFFRTEENQERDWIYIAALSFFTLLLTYHRTYDMRIQILSFPALGILWRRSIRLAGILTVLSALSMFSTSIILEKWATAHFGNSIAHHLMFRLFVERQQAVAVLLATFAWAIACVSLNRQRVAQGEPCRVQAQA